MSNRYLVVARKLSGTIEFADQGARAQVSYGGQSETVPGRHAGATLWGLMKQAGVNPQSVNSFVVYEANDEGLTVAHLHAVLEGARVVWLVLYRADRASSAFMPLGNRQRIGDALDACFQRVLQDIELPHKP